MNKKKIFIEIKKEIYDKLPKKRGEISKIIKRYLNKIANGNRNIKKTNPLKIEFENAIQGGVRNYNENHTVLIDEFDFIYLTAYDEVNNIITYKELLTKIDNKISAKIIEIEFIYRKLFKIKQVNCTNKFANIDFVDIKLDIDFLMSPCDIFDWNNRDNNYFAYCIEN